MLGIEALSLGCLLPNAGRNAKKPDGPPAMADAQREATHIYATPILKVNN
jgi:hypothetical protein